jgi:hypothetical protein
VSAFFLQQLYNLGLAIAGRQFQHRSAVVALGLDVGAFLQKLLSRCDITFMGSLEQIGNLAFGAGLSEGIQSVQQKHARQKKDLLHSSPPHLTGGCGEKFIRGRSVLPVITSCRPFSKATWPLPTAPATFESHAHYRMTVFLLESKLRKRNKPEANAELSPPNTGPLFLIAGRRLEEQAGGTPAPFYFAVNCNSGILTSDDLIHRKKFNSDRTTRHDLKTSLGAAMRSPELRKVTYVLPTLVVVTNGFACS